MSTVKFIDNSDKAKQALREGIEAALEAIGNQCVTYAKQNITAAGRVDTGALRNSVSHLVKIEDEAVYVGTNQEYAVFNEMGTGIHTDGGGGRQTPWVYQDARGEWHTTRGIKPIHFLRNAAQDHVDEFQRIAEQEIKAHQP